MTTSVTLTLYRPEGIDPVQQHVWPMLVVASEKVFLHMAREHGLPYDGDLYVGVCTAADMETVPEDSPGTEGTYRWHKAKFMARHDEEANDIWKCVQEDVESLVGDLASLEALNTN